MKKSNCLTIAGLDPTGGAGMTADLRVFRRLGTYGLSALTAATPQNTGGVKGIHPVSKTALKQSLDAVFEDFPISAMKTGQIPNKELAQTIVKSLKSRDIQLVIDPVMLPTRGMWLVEKDAVEYMKKSLLPMAAIITPNAEEAGWLARMEIHSLPEAEEAATKLVPKVAPAIVITGIEIDDYWIVDLFFDGKTLKTLRAKRKDVGDIHGTGCHYSAALTAYLAKGKELFEAVKSAKKFIASLIDTALVDPTGKMKMLDS